MALGMTWLEYKEPEPPVDWQPPPPKRRLGLRVERAPAGGTRDNPFGRPRET